MQKNYFLRLKKVSIVGIMLATIIVFGEYDNSITYGVRNVAAASVPAFPGAEGFGANAKGGRGGRVIEVTNLNDSGNGSLRAAINASGPRTVVFRVGGTINVKSRLEIKNPYITIAGQSAPGDGILLRNDPGNLQATLLVETHDVIIRYIRIRPGPSAQKSSVVDALDIEKGQNIIIDHSSFSWATDEVVSTWLNPRNVTIQWSIISEALHCSTHSKGCHSKGMMIGSNGSERISIHHNLFAHNKQRNPFIKSSGVVDVVNNVMYNPVWAAAVVTDDYAKGQVNFVGNYFKRGRDSQDDDMLNASGRSGKGFAIYVNGNITPNRVNNNQPENLALKSSSRQWVVNSRHNAPRITTQSAEQAYQSVLNGAGATLPKRDSVDARVVNEVRIGQGRIIDHPSQVGGWPTMRNGTPPTDSDRDGMPNNWEKQYGFNPNNANDGNGDNDGDGYTNLEEYLNGTNPKGSGNVTKDEVASAPTPTPVPAQNQAPTPTPVPVQNQAPTPIPNQPGNCNAFFIEAEKGSFTSPFVVANDPAASNGKFIWVPEGTRSRLKLQSDEYFVQYNVSLTAAAKYRLKGWVYAESGKANSFFVRVNGQPSSGLVWKLGLDKGFHPEYVNHDDGPPSEFNLSAGNHTIKVYLREDGARLDKLIVERVGGC